MRPLLTRAAALIGATALLASCATTENTQTWNVSAVYADPAVAMPDGMAGSTIFLMSDKHMVGQDVCGGFQAKVNVTDSSGKKVALTDESAASVSFSELTAQDANCDGQNLYVHLKIVSLINGEYEVIHQPTSDGYTMVTLTRQANADDPTSKEGFQLICG
ncbi:MAG: hypothetical protein Q3972_07620 [Corynebacterium sp.]|nr:hypothetical protein [Corynebacterium sp.]